jgi:two-component system KDP operon response regulator KdpE
MTSTPPKASILIVEDEATIRRFLRASLESQGFAVLEALTGREGLALAGANVPDLILLDLGLPDLDGLDVLRKLREFAQTPVVILSARGQERDKIEGLDAGADDYLTKPFGVGELLARVRVALRRRWTESGQAGPSVVMAGGLRIDLEARCVSRGGVEIHLTPKEWKIVAFLARHAGRVVTGRQLLQEVWGSTAPGQEHYVRAYIHQLRQKLEENPALPALLLTEPWVGYRLAADETEL